MHPLLKEIVACEHGLDLLENVHIFSTLPTPIEFHEPHE